MKKINILLACLFCLAFSVIYGQDEDHSSDILWNNKDFTEALKDYAWNVGYLKEVSLSPCEKEAQAADRFLRQEEAFIVKFVRTMTLYSTSNTVLSTLNTDWESQKFDRIYSDYFILGKKAANVKDCKSLRNLESPVEIIRAFREKYGAAIDEYVAKNRIYKK